MAQVLEICLKYGMYHCLVVLYQVCLNECRRIQDDPAPGTHFFEPYNSLTSNACNLVFGFPGGPLLSLFKQRSQEPRWLRARGS